MRNLSRALVDALSRVSSAQPSQIAGYWENREFWIAEFRHLLDAIDGYNERLERMRRAQDSYTAKHGGGHNTDEFGVPRQRVRDTTHPSSRRFAASEARTALKALADRAMDLHIASSPEYDIFVKQLRVSNRDSSST